MAPVVRRGKRLITVTTPTTVLQNGSGRRKKANRRTSDTLFFMNSLVHVDSMNYFIPRRYNMAIRDLVSYRRDA